MQLLIILLISLTPVGFDCEDASTSSTVVSLSKLSPVDTCWRFTGVYGWPDSTSKHLTCKLLDDLKQRNNKPWLLGGDLNEIFYNYEKRGGPAKCQRMLELFRDSYYGFDLWDVGYTGHPFTWWNGRDGEDSVEERGWTDLWRVVTGPHASHGLK